MSCSGQLEIDKQKQMQANRQTDKHVFVHIFAQIFLHRYFCSPVFGGFIIAGGDLSRSHYSRLLGAPLIYCMGDILTPPGLYIVPATQINRNERDHQTVVPQTIFWSFECKSTNSTDLLEAKKAIYRH